MKKMWKNVLGIVLVAAISAGAAVGTSAYLINKNQPVFGTSGSANTFNQPIRLAGYNTVAAENTDFTTAAESTVHGVVHIKATTNAKQYADGGNQSQYVDPFEYFFGFGGRGGFQRPQPQPRVGAGSGVIISTDGYIITNNHVIDGADELEVTLNDNRKFAAKLVGTDPTTDIALLKIDAKDLPTIPFGDSEKLKVGEWVLAVGNPFNLTSTVTAGIVSAKGRGISMGGGDKSKIESFIQTDAAVNPGNSGGALVNTAGELVGINTAIYSETGSYAGYSFAIPTSIVSKVIADLKEYGTVQRAVLGIGYREIDSELAKEENLEVQEGIYVGEVYNRSAAMEAGIKEGDVITSINGVKIKNGAMLSEQLSKYRPGDKIKIGLLRGKESKTVSLTLKNSQGNTEITKIAGMDSLGAGFKELDTKSLREMNIRYGVQVIGLKNGKFKAAGMREGFVILEINNTPMKSVSDLESMYDSIVKSNQNQKVMFITGIYPNGKMMYYAVDLAD